MNIQSYGTAAPRIGSTIGRGLIHRAQQSVHMPSTAHPKLPAKTVILRQPRK